MRYDRIVDVVAGLSSELRSLDRLAADLVDTWETLPVESREKKIHEAALALKLHNFYTGTEKIFEQIADELNGGIVASREWHKRLLRSMTLELPQIRPAVISEKTEQMLSEFLAFRHIVRNIYAFELDSDRLSLLMRRFPVAYTSLKGDLTNFIAFLQQTVERDSNG